MFLGRSLFAVAASVLAAQAAFGVLRILHVRRFIGFSPLPAFARILAAGMAGMVLASLPWPVAVKVPILIAVFAGLGGAKADDFRRVMRWAWQR
jgi:hypothetical protein